MSLDPLSSLPRLQPTATTGPGLASGGGFARVLAQVLGEASAADAQATAAIQELASGEAEDVHTAVLAVAQADLGFRLALELRNRLQEAYQQITQLQV